MPITVSPVVLDTLLARDLKNLLGSDPYAATVEERLDPVAGAIGFVASIDGHLGGYAHLQQSAHQSGTWFLDTIVPGTHPSATSLTETLLNSARQRLETHSLSWWTQGPHAAVVSELAHRRDFKMSRQVLRMEAVLTGTESRTVLPFRFYQDGDEDLIAAINNAAFVGHADRANWTPETVRATLADRSVLLLAPPGQPTAFVWLKGVNAKVSEVQVLASHPAARGAGVGRGLLRTALGELHRRGHQVACLYVEAENHHARHMYANEGFVESGGPLIAYHLPPLRFSA